MEWIQIPPQEVARFQSALQYIAHFYGGHIYANDLLITLCKNTTFLWDQAFVSAFSSTAENNDEKSVIWRTHTVTWAAKQALHIEGDFVECGVYRALSATVICKYLAFQNVPKTFYLYDTFTGMEPETATAAEMAAEARYKQEDSDKWLAFVQQRLASFPNTKIVKGMVPMSFDQAVPDKIAFLHVDMNSAQAEERALERLFDRVTPGGIILLDDFGWIGNRPQTLSQIPFFAKRNHTILEIPTGQGMVIKHA